MASAGDLVVATGKYQAPPGVPGEQGPAGTGDIGVPAGAGSYGRLNAAWAGVMPLTGDQMTGGLGFGSDVAASSVDLSRHIALWGTSYGFCVTGGTMNYVSGGDHQFLSNGAQAGCINNSGIKLSADNWKLDFNRGNGDLIFYHPNGSPLYGWHGAVGGFCVWGDCDIAVGGSQGIGAIKGMIFTNIGGNNFCLNWSGVYVYGRVDNVLQWPFAPGLCDAKLKQDIAPSSFGCLDTIRRIRLFQFRWQDHTVPGKPRRARRADSPLVPVGFVAQRLYEDCPSLVHRPPEAPEGGMNLWVIERNTMLATLVGAVKELDRAVAALRR